jgi:hypothetical protein
MNKSLNSFISTHQMIRLQTKHPDGTAFDCIPLMESKSMFIVMEMTSFEPDGFVVVPRKWLLKIRDGEIERTGNSVIQHDRTIADVPKCPSEFAGTKTLAELMSRLQATNIWPAIEIIRKRKGIVYVGPITKVSANSFRMHRYSASGEWLDETEIAYKDLFKVEIESRYIEHFNSYMRSKLTAKAGKQ